MALEINGKIGSRINGFFWQVLLLFLFSASCCLGQSKLLLFTLAVKDNRPQLSNGTLVDEHLKASETPVFDPKKPSLYFISEGDAIVGFDYDSLKKTTLTKSGVPISRLSITVDQKFISAIQTDQVGSSALVKFSLDGGDQTAIIPSITFSNYAWVTDNSLIVLVPGEPNTLQLYNIRPKRGMIIAKNVGQCIQRFFNTPSVSFVHKLSVDYSSIKRIKADDGRIVIITDTLPDQEVFAWTPEERLIMTDGDKLFYYDRNRSSSWKEISVDHPTPLGKITGIAVSPAGDKIALAVSD
ncbi:MAG TPA: WD40 repeat domain-containing protein [Ohtaekwangia sp.]|nr:WD40 repeat domain-containing protein [Ohtaekwangia sp.]